MGETQELPLVGVGLGGDDDPPHVDAHQTLVDMDLSYDRKRWMVIVSKGLFKNGDQRLLTLTGLLGQALTSCS